MLEDSLGTDSEFAHLKSKTTSEKNMLKELANLEETLELKNYDVYLK